MRAYSIKDVGQFFLIGVTDGPIPDFRPEIDGDLISLYRVSHELYEIYRVPFTQIQNAAGLTYGTAAETYAYLVEELTLSPPQPPALKGVYKAAETISALKAVYFSGDGVVSLASNDTFEKSMVVGIALTAGGAGDFVDVRLFGLISDNSLTFGINKPLFLTSGGNYSLNPPTSGTLTRVAKSLGTGAIFVKVEEPIQL